MAQNGVSHLTKISYFEHFPDPFQLQKVVLCEMPKPLATILCDGNISLSLTKCTKSSTFLLFIASLESRIRNSWVLIVGTFEKVQTMQRGGDHGHAMEHTVAGIKFYYHKTD